MIDGIETKRIADLTAPKQQQGQIDRNKEYTRKRTSKARQAFAAPRSTCIFRCTFMHLDAHSNNHADCSKATS